MQCAEGSEERGGQCTGNVHVFVRSIAQASRVFLDNCTLTSGPELTLSPIKISFVSQSEIQTSCRIFRIKTNLIGLNFSRHSG